MRIAHRCISVAAAWLLVAPLSATTSPGGHSGAPASAAATIDAAINRMGGADVLRQIRRVRIDDVVQWLNTRFDDQSHSAAPLYNVNSDLRDYDLNARRQTRRQGIGIPSGGSWPEFVDLVNDTLPIVRNTDGHTWTLSNVAHVDEMHEAFFTAPERILLAIRAAIDLRHGADTLINGQAQLRIVATVPSISDHPLTLFLRRRDTIPTMLRFRSIDHNDAQLSSLGDMEVETWWSGWFRSPLTGTPGVLYPREWDIDRVHVPFQRITVLTLNFNVPATPDSFAVSDSLRHAYLNSNASRSMVNLALVDSGAIAEGHFASQRRNGFVPLAVLIGNRWIMLLDGGLTLAMRQRQEEWLEHQVAGSHIGAGVVVAPNGYGTGIGALAARGLPALIAPGAARSVAAIGVDWNEHGHGTVVTAGRWIRLGEDSAWVEPYDLPGSSMPGAMLLYVPALHWLYTPTAGGADDLENIRRLVKMRGWTADRIGTFRNIITPLSPASPAGPTSH